MKVAAIAPVDLLEFCRRDSYHMILPEPYEKSEDYRNWAQSIEGFKLLDNGVIEGNQVDINRMLQIAHAINASEVIAPDVLDDCDTTIMAVGQFLNELEEMSERSFDVMAVVQGKNVAEYLKCLSAFAQDTRITSVGIPRRMTKVLNSKWARVSFAEIMLHHGMFERFEVHYLGANDWLREVVCLGETPARGIDTSLPFVMALEGLPLRHQTQYVERQGNFFYVPLGYYLDNDTYGPIPREVIIDNLRTYRDWAGDI